MKPDIDILRRHNLGREEALRMADEIAHTLGRQAGARYGWDGDSLVFSGSGARGVVHVGEDYLHILIATGPLLRLMRGRIEAGIHDHLDRHLS